MLKLARTLARTFVHARTGLTAVLACASAGWLVAAGLALAPDLSHGATGVAPLPQHLADTGWQARGVMAFAPQYPLWTDGADKRRWIWLPPGSAVDARRPDAWQFPIGTRLWKEFSFGGRPVETRYLERLSDGRWRFAAYVWNAAGTDALLAPEAGVRGLPTGVAAPATHDVPSRTDCLACHAGAAVPVLGFSALQLSPERDPLAPHASHPEVGLVDLPALVHRGRLKNLDPALLAVPPRIPAADALERAALGYLHGNCAHCHNHLGRPVPVALTLSQTVADAPASLQRVRASLFGAPLRFHAAELATTTSHAAAAVPLRMRSREPRLQMPPLGTRVPDPEGLALIERWLANTLSPNHPLTPEEQLP